MDSKTSSDLAHEAKSAELFTDELSALPAAATIQATQQASKTDIPSTTDVQEHDSHFYDEPDGWRHGDSKGDSEKAALRVLGYEIERIPVNARGAVPKGSIVPGMDYFSIWSPGLDGIPPVLKHSKANKTRYLMKTVQQHIDASVNIRKKEYEKFVGQPYSRQSPPSYSTNSRNFGHWKMIKSLEEFLSYCYYK